MKVSPSAGKAAEAAMLVSVPRLVTAYYTEAPDPSVPEQRVAFGTSGHRGSALTKALNEGHILAVSQTICLYRAERKIDGFQGADRLRRILEEAQAIVNDTLASAPNPGNPNPE
jgi:phosphoglucomutase